MMLDIYTWVYKTPMLTQNLDCHTNTSIVYHTNILLGELYYNIMFVESNTKLNVSACMFMYMEYDNIRTGDNNKLELAL